MTDTPSAETLLWNAVESLEGAFLCAEEDSDFSWLFTDGALGDWRELLEHRGTGHFDALISRLDRDQRATLYRRLDTFVPPWERRRGCNGFRTADVFGEFAPTPYIVKHLIEPGELAVLFGESGSMKSFVAADLALHVGSGRDWCGHRVRRGAVLYVAAEGGSGFRRRVRAWLIRQGIGADDPQPAVWVGTDTIDLFAGSGALADLIAVAEAALGEPVEFVVIDTLSAAFGGGDENKTSDLNRVLTSVRAACGPRAVLVVHHVGHGDKTRERGSYALRGAADRRFLIERNESGDLLTMTVLKAKDDRCADPIAFEWQAVELGWHDPDGEMLTSIVLEPSARTPEPKSAGPSGRNQRAVIGILRESGPLTKTDLIRKLVAVGLNRTSCYRAINDLADAGIITEGLQKWHLIDPK